VEYNAHAMVEFTREFYVLISAAMADRVMLCAWLFVVFVCFPFGFVIQA